MVLGVQLLLPLRSSSLITDELTLKPIVLGASSMMTSRGLGDSEELRTEGEAILTGSVSAETFGGVRGAAAAGGDLSSG